MSDDQTVAAQNDDKGKWRIKDGKRGALLGRNEA